MSSKKQEILDNLSKQLSLATPWVTDSILPEFVLALKKFAPENTVSDPTVLALFKYQPDLLRELNQSDLVQIASVLPLNIGTSANQMLVQKLSRGDCQYSTITNPQREFELFSESVSFLQKNSPDFATEVKAVLRHFIKVSSHQKFAAASHPHVWGTIIISDHFLEMTPAERSLSLVHESAHQELFLINLLDRLVAKESEFALVHAPFQGKERPPIARLHAAHVLYRMCQYNKQLGENYLQDIMMLRQTLETFGQNDLTDFAQKALIYNYREFCETK